MQPASRQRNVRIALLLRVRLLAIPVALQAVLKRQPVPYVTKSTESLPDTILPMQPAPRQRNVRIALLPRVRLLAIPAERLPVRIRLIVLYVTSLTVSLQIIALLPKATQNSILQARLPVPQAQPTISPARFVAKREAKHLLMVNPTSISFSSLIPTMMLHIPLVVLTVNTPR